MEITKKKPSDDKQRGHSHRDTVAHHEEKHKPQRKTHAHADMIVHVGDNTGHALLKRENSAIKMQAMARGIAQRKKKANNANRDIIQKITGS